MAQEGIQDALNFVDGIKLLLDETEKAIDINDSLSKIISLIFSDYWRQRGWAYQINKEFSSLLPRVYAAQDRIGYLFLSLLLTLRRVRALSLNIQTLPETRNGGDFVVIKAHSPGAIPLEKNIVMRGIATGIGLELAKKIIRELNGRIEISGSGGNINGFLIRLPAINCSIFPPEAAGDNEEEKNIKNIFIQTINNKEEEE